MDAAGLTAASLARRAAAWAAVGVFLCVALGFGLAAIWGLLAAEYGPINASGIIAGVCLALAVVMALWLRHRAARRRKVAARQLALQQAAAANSTLPAITTALHAFMTAMEIGRSLRR